MPYYDESWEFQNNTSDRMLYKSNDFESTYTDPETQETFPAWKNDFEARFPEDTYEDITQLKTFVTWVMSTDTTAATGDTLEAPVTYAGVEYTQDTAAYRLAKFKAEFADYAETDSFVFYYIFTELFLMVDSRAKNFFLGFHGGECSIEGMRRKAVAEPYDMDTALGTNNEGSLVFPYWLEDTDHLEGGADVFNGQQSVLWNNLRETHRVEITGMYKTLRSTGAISYSLIEGMYERHQSKWPEAIVNEDSRFKYILPLTDPDPGKEPTGAYLPMEQGLKTEQRKWWLYNRIRYEDSKYNAGDALLEVIQLRGYAKADITVTPYAAIYPTVKYGSYLVQTRGSAGVPATLACPLDNVNDTEIYIYSASQVASAGDLSDLKVGFADFSMATHLQEIKVGDAGANYTNANLNTLTVGSNKLLRKIDARNCTALGTGNQKSVDLSGCEIIEEVYFDGTAIQGVQLPNGGVLKKLHLPATVTNITIRNQKLITEFVCAGYSNITTLRLENNSAAVDDLAILQAVPANTRVRLVGFCWEAQDAAEIEDILDTLDTMRGLDESGNNMDTAQCVGEIHTANLTGAQIAAYSGRYPYIAFTADYVESTLTCMSYDNTTVLAAITCINGVPQTAVPSAPSKPDSADGHYSYTAVGWNTLPDQETNDPAATTNVIANRTIYPAYTETVKTYTATFRTGANDGGGLQQEVQVAWGETPVYTGATPRSTRGTAEDYPFLGWIPAPGPIKVNTTYISVFGEPAEIDDDWETILSNPNYATDYHIGDIKSLDLGSEGVYMMQIVAFNTDTRADGQGKAHITWLSKDLLYTTHNMNPANVTTGGWPSCGMRAYLQNSIKPLIPQAVRNGIVPVKKVTGAYTSGAVVIGGDITTDELWIPSVHELYGYQTYETPEKGCVYYSMFRDDHARRKSRNSGYQSWWMRTPLNDEKFGFVNNQGQFGTGTPTAGIGVDLGFCT